LLFWQAAHLTPNAKTQKIIYFLKYPVARLMVKLTLSLARLRGKKEKRKKYENMHYLSKNIANGRQT